MKDFRTLKVWEKAHDLTLRVYRATTTFPPDERFGLTVTMRRTASAIPMKIADGCGRDGDGEFARVLQMAFSSACELEYQLLLAKDLGFLTPEQHTPLDGLTIEVKKMLVVLLQKLRPTY